MVSHRNTPQLIVMLTHNDKTIDNAWQVFDGCKHSQAQFFGMKDGTFSTSQMKTIFDYMKQYNKTTVLEVVQYDEAESLAGAKLAVECQVDILMGTCFFDSVNEYCQAHQLKYMPFVGEIYDRPSILTGTVESMLAQIDAYQQKGVHGIDLLGYRYVGNAELLNETLVTQSRLPIVIAGSIDSTQKLDEMKRISPFAFTIGSAFFEHKFGDDLTEQINFVCEYLKQ